MQAFYTRLYGWLFAVLPWSVELELNGAMLTFPAELLQVVLSLLVAREIWRRPQLLKTIFVNRPVAYLSAALLLWMGISACFSDIPLVAFKYIIVEYLHWWVGFVGLLCRPGLLRRVVPVLLLSLACFAVYVLAHHANYHFRMDQALLAPQPFFPEHNIWAALLGMAFWALLAWRRETAVLLRGLLPDTRMVAPAIWLIGLLFVGSLLLTGSRGGWGSMWVTLAPALAFRCRDARWYLLLLPLLALAPRWTRDVSAQERINRWKCALRMAEARPVTGVGPGVYPFQYIDYQRDEDRTRISADSLIRGHMASHFGRGGGAHSEFARALAESGWPGLLLWMSLLIAATGRGIRRGDVWPTLAFLGFAVHGLVNDFLHDSTIAALFWALLVRIGANRPHKS